MTLAALRNTRPSDAGHLHDWVSQFTGVKVAREKVCRGHSPPFDAFASQVLDRPDVALWLGPRGGGKSFLSALDTHLTSRWTARSATRILGGSLAQSGQIYEALKAITLDGRGRLGTDRRAVTRLLKTQAEYRNGSEVSILACSTTSVRGPHVATLKLDEVDEIDPALRRDAYGMCMAKGGLPASILMTSTWHRVGGPMEGLIGQAEAGEFPLHRFCVFEVVERCPESRSGPWVGGEAGHENCPACPIKRWCHAERDINGDVPLAKLADGHYAIDSVIQKVKAECGVRGFEADYLCKGPKAEGLWFPQFDARNVDVAAEFDPSLPVHVSIDSGVFTAAVFVQVRRLAGNNALVTCFADYLAEGLTAEVNARAVMAIGEGHCNGRREVVSTDPAGASRVATGGPTVIAEYCRAGLCDERHLKRWPIGPVSDSLAALEALVRSADGTIGLLVHPRCRHLIAAFGNYRRAKRQGQWQDYPEDPNHPAEDLMDALRGAVKVEFPEGRKPEPRLRRVPGRRVF